MVTIAEHAVGGLVVIVQERPTVHKRTSSSDLHDHSSSRFAVRASGKQLRNHDVSFLARHVAGAVVLPVRWASLAGMALVNSDRYFCTRVIHVQLGWILTCTSKCRLRLEML